MGLTDFYKSNIEYTEQNNKRKFFGDCLAYIVLLTLLVNIIKTLYVYLGALKDYVKKKISERKL